jgi:hypothetical protein
MASEATFDIATPQGRRWRRCQFTAPVRLTIEKFRHLNAINTHGSRINDGGLAVHAHTELTIGEEAEIRFMPPHFYPFVRLRGVIRNREGDLYGVEFQATSTVEKEQLALFRRILARLDVA